MSFASHLSCAALAALALTSLAGCDQKAAPAPKAPLQVKVSVLEPASAPLRSDVVGQTEAREAVDIHAQITGPLLEKLYEEGAAVKKGDLLFRIDPRPFRAAWDSAAASAEQARATFEQAEREAGRYRELWKAKSVSEKDFSDKQSAAAIARAQWEAAKAKEREAKITLGYTEIRSPVDGIAGTALVNPGALITANSTKLTDITQDKKLKVRFAVTDQDLQGRSITASTPVEVFRNSEDSPVKAAIDYRAGQIDPTTGSRPYSAVLEDSALLPGQYVTVRLSLGTLDNIYLVPQSAVRQLSDGTYSVYLLKDGKAHAQAVKVGRWLGTDWIVTEGLKPGDVLITNQQQRLKDKLPVQAAKSSGS